MSHHSRLANQLVGRDSYFSGAEMGRRQTDGSEARFEAYVDGLASVIGHAEGRPTARLLHRPDIAG
jgi:hypothetical protein